MDTKSVLIVDDEESFLASLEEGLEDCDFSILTARNGKEALSILGSNPVDLVVTDLKMPEMGGYELVAYMGRSFPGTPVIVMTAHGAPEMEENFRLLGVSSYVEKPVDIEAMARSIQESLDETRVGSKLISASAQEVIAKLFEVLNSGVGGEVIVTHGDVSGKIFVTKGKIAWVSVSSQKQYFFTYLTETVGLGSDELKGVFEECRASGRNFGETIVEWGLLSREALRDALLEYISRGMLEILSWPKSEIMFVNQERSYKGGLLFDLEEIIGNELRKKELVDLPMDGLDDIRLKSEESFRNAEAALASLRDLEGFLAAGAFSPSGYCLAQVSEGFDEIAEIGHLANDVLLEAQRATDIMDVGRGNMVHITAPRASILARCLNENQDLRNMEPGRAHVHLILVIESESNPALARLELERVIARIAPEFR